MANKRIAGICYIKVDGAQLDVNGGIECPISETVKEMVMGDSGPSGFKETASEQYVKLTANFKADFPLEAVRSGTGLTITAEFPNGKTYTLSDAVLVEESTAKSADGTVELKFSGMKGTWA